MMKDFFFTDSDGVVVGGNGVFFPNLSWLFKRMPNLKKKAKRITTDSQKY